MKNVRRRDIKSLKLVSHAGTDLHSSFFFLAIATYIGKWITISIRLFFARPSGVVLGAIGW